MQAELINIYEYLINNFNTTKPNTKPVIEYIIQDKFRNGFTNEYIRFE
jgi:hypothetical protein